jgi:hypothetical protein
MFDMETIVITTIAVIVGGLITWFISWRYYQRAAEELRNEASELKHLTTLKSVEPAPIRAWAAATQMSGSVSSFASVSFRRWCRLRSGSALRRDAVRHPAGRPRTPRGVRPTPWDDSGRPGGHPASHRA